MDQAKKRIKTFTLTTAETHELATETAQKIIKALKEGHSGEEEEEEEEEEDEGEQRGEEEEEEEEEEVVGDKEQLEDEVEEDGEEDDEDDEEELIHMYSDEGETQEPSITILDKSF